jgi:hypothetical protein
MTTISTTGKIGYVYDENSDTWYPIAGNASTAADYEWTGNHEFSGNGGTNFVTSATFNDTVIITDGFNNFQTTTARDAAIPSPAEGTLCYVRQSSINEPINQLQVYVNGGWRAMNAAVFANSTSSFTLSKLDIGKTVLINTTSNITVTIAADTNNENELPIGSRIEVVRANTGEVEFTAAVGVTLRSKNNYVKIGATYSGAMLTKIANNEWLLLGDLKA